MLKHFCLQYSNKINERIPGMKPTSRDIRTRVGASRAARKQPPGVAAAA